MNQRYIPCPTENSPEAASSAAGFGESEGKSSPSFRRLSGCADAREPPRASPKPRRRRTWPPAGRASPQARLPARERRAEEGPRGLAPPRFRGSGRPKALPPDGRAAPRRSPRPAPVTSRRRPAHPGAGERSGPRGPRWAGRAGGGAGRTPAGSGNSPRPASDPGGGRFPVPAPGLARPFPGAPLPGSPSFPLRPCTWPPVAPYGGETG